MIQVTEPFLPPLEQYLEKLKSIWAKRRLTNDGPLVRELESRLCEVLGVPFVTLVANGTLALQLALRALGIRGEVLTTPFTHVATTAALVWEGCEPRFVDIDETTWTLDPDQARKAIGPTTSGILATHVYGVPVDVTEMGALAAEHRLPVIYDASHCFGVRFRGRSLLRFGAAATVSFHATKVFHTVEGGAIVTESESLHERLSWLRNFGHAGPEDFAGVGINAKMSEFHAAMGLCNLDHVDEVIAKRLRDCDRYDRLLAASPLRRPQLPQELEYNGAYYPVLFPSEEALVATVSRLEAEGISPRRYFFPSLSSLRYVRPSEVPVAEEVSRKVLCLPLSFSLSNEDIDKTASVVLDVLRSVAEA